MIPRCFFSLEKHQDRFVKNDEANASMLLASLFSMKQKAIFWRTFLLKMSNLTSKLKALNLELSDDLLVYLILISLHAQFSQFKVTYNCKRRSGLWMRSFHTVCKRKRDGSKIGHKSTHMSSISKGKSKT